jgi:hypothetical protein
MLGQDALESNCLIASTNAMACCLVEVTSSTCTVVKTGAAATRLDIPKNTTAIKITTPLLNFKCLFI